MGVQCVRLHLTTLPLNESCIFGRNFTSERHETVKNSRKRLDFARFGRIEQYITRSVGETRYLDPALLPNLTLSAELERGAPNFFFEPCRKLSHPHQ